jgi:hypothetical protein
VLAQTAEGVPATQPVENADPAKYPAVFRLRPDDLVHLPVVPTLRQNVVVPIEARRRDLIMRRADVSRYTDVRYGSSATF